jgi:hypothetical protein
MEPVSWLPTAGNVGSSSVAPRAQIEFSQGLSFPFEDAATQGASTQVSTAVSGADLDGRATIINRGLVSDRVAIEFFSNQPGPVVSPDSAQVITLAPGESFNIAHAFHILPGEHTYAIRATPAGGQIFASGRNISATDLVGMADIAVEPLTIAPTQRAGSIMLLPVTVRNRSDQAVGPFSVDLISAHHGQRYCSWRLAEGKFEFFEDEEKLGAEKRLDGKYVIATSEKGFTALEAVAAYKQLGEVERGFRSMKDVIALRPIWHHSATRVKGHIFVAALALLLERLLEKWLKEAGVNLSAREAMLAVQTIRFVRFEVAGQARCGVTVGSARARQVLAALGLHDLRPPTPPEGQQTVV